MNARALPVVLVSAALAAACVSKLDRVELTPKGPSAQDLYISKSYAVNGRAPTFSERRHWEAQVEERVWTYLRAHPELEQTSRYSDFRFWWTVTNGSTPAEVRALLEEPEEQTADPVRMAALAGPQWSEIEGKTKEAWFYPPSWVLYFDETSVVAIVHKVSAMTPTE